MLPYLVCFLPCRTSEPVYSEEIEFVDFYIFTAEIEFIANQMCRCELIFA